MAEAGNPVTTVLSRPMMRVAGAPVEAPYYLRAARLREMGGVRALKAPEAANPPAVLGGAPPEQRLAAAYPYDEPPYVLWNYEYLNRRSGAQDGETYVIEDAASHHGRLYGTCRGTSPATRVFPSDYGTGGEVEIEPPTIYEVDADPETPFSRGRTGVAKDRGCKLNTWQTYLFIPLSATDEAGPWLPYSYYVEKETEDAPFPAWQITFRLKVSPSTSFVELYKMRERVTDTEAGNYDTDFYYVGRFAVTERSLSRFVYAIDDKRWVPLLVDEQTQPEAETVVPLARLERRINLHAAQYVHVPSPDPDDEQFYRAVRREADNADGSPMESEPASPWGNWLYATPGANTIHNEGGRMLYGGVSWPMKEPGILLWKRDDVDGLDLVVQYEYATSQTTYYGPPLRLNDVDLLDVLWQGEAALRVYVRDPDAGDSEWYLWERLVPDIAGRYRSTHSTRGVTFERQSVTDMIYSDVSGQYSKWSLFGMDRYHLPGQIGGPGSVLVPMDPSGRYVYEKNVIFFAERDRPWEVSLGQDELPEDTEIRYITHARQGEEETQLSYTFYIFTDQSLYAARLIEAGGGPVLEKVPVTPKGPGLGVRMARISPTDGRASYAYPLVTLTRQGVVFVGSDGRVYYVQGRYPPQALDQAVPGLWHGPAGVPLGDGTTLAERMTITALAYNTERDEVLVQTTGGVWIYSFPREGFIGQLDAPAPTYETIAERQHTGEIVGMRSASGELVPYELDDPEEAYGALERSDRALVTLQPAAAPGGQALAIEHVQLAYEAAVVHRSRWIATLAEYDGDVNVELETLLPAAIADQVGSPVRLTEAGLGGVSTDGLLYGVVKVQGTLIQGGEPNREDDERFLQVVPDHGRAPAASQGVGFSDGREIDILRPLTVEQHLQDDLLGYGAQLRVVTLPVRFSTELLRLPLVGRRQQLAAGGFAMLHAITFTLTPVGGGTR